MLLKRNKRDARASGFRRKTPSHGLFTQFRHRLGRDGYEKVFSMLLEQLLKSGAVKGEVVALDGTAIKAYSQRSLDNKTGKSDHEARVGGARRGFILGYKVHAVCCVGSELPLAFKVEPCNMNEKRFIKPLLEKLGGMAYASKLFWLTPSTTRQRLWKRWRSMVLNQLYLTRKHPELRTD